ncbi:MAG: TetR/AcrR family transcriptional regulator [Spirochaetes bacterium]|nr:TetR/AcrR family transcriptional regulator [Spirochaetota bacterium]
MNKKERKEYILNCARTVFTKKGFHATTVTDIIQHARIARSTFYAHFTSKDEIFSILVDNFLASLVEKILSINISRAHSESTLATDIREMTLELVEFIEKNADIARLIITAQQGYNTFFDKKIEEFFRTVHASIQKLLEEGIQEGNVRPCRSEIIAYAILGCIKQVMLHWLVFGEISDIRPVLVDLIAYNLYGIALKVPVFK